ncbi:MAG: DoxX family protein [Chloroflexota bacterium]
MDAGTFRRIALVIGRIIVGGVFVWAAVDNLLDLPAKADYAAFKGVPAPMILVGLASLVLLAGAISILVGFRPVLGVLAITAFLVPVTLTMHNFWALTGLNAILELHNFQGNLIMLGGAFMFLAIPGPWPVSVDGWLYAARFRAAPERGRAIAA